MNETIPLILLFLFGGFAIVSALLKVRLRLTALSSVILIMVEALSGVALMVAAFPTSGSLETAARMGIITASIVGMSSLVHLFKVRGKIRAYEASEGRRLHLAVKYGVGRGKVYDEPAPHLDLGANGDTPSGSKEAGVEPSGPEESGAGSGS